MKCNRLDANMNVHFTIDPTAPTGMRLDARYLLLCLLFVPDTVTNPESLRDHSSKLQHLAQNIAPMIQEPQYSVDRVSDHAQSSGTSTNLIGTAVEFDFFYRFPRLRCKRDIQRRSELRITRTVHAHVTY